MESLWRHGEGMTAASSLPGENQSLGDLNLFLVVRRLMPCAFLFSTAVLVIEDPVAFGEGAGVAKHDRGCCSGEVDGERVQCVGKPALEGSARKDDSGTGGGERERRVKASRIGLSRRDLRDRDLDSRDDEAFEVNEEDAGGVYSKGEPSVVATGAKELGGARAGKSKVAVSGVVKARKEYVAFWAGTFEDESASAAS